MQLKNDNRTPLLDHKNLVILTGWLKNNDDKLKGSQPDQPREVYMQVVYTQIKMEIGNVGFCKGKKLNNLEKAPFQLHMG